LPLHHYGPDVVIDDFSRFFSVAEQLMA
jgi:hypothetical protein